MLYNRQTKETVYPKDRYIEIEELPFKITKRMMVETAFYGQNQTSFKEGSSMIEKAMGIEINRETVRQVSDYIGNLVYEKDKEQAEDTYKNIEKIGDQGETEGKIKPKTIYIMMDGAAINTRVEDENGSTWRENKLVICFTDKDMIMRKDKSNEVVKKEYMSYIGSSNEFKKFVLEVAVKADYGIGHKLVIIADGATWIRNMCEELFPDGVQILDKFHLCENIYTYFKYKHNNDVAQYTKNAEIIIDKIEKGEINEALALLPKEEKLPAGIPNLRGYIENNIDKINYPEYIKKGYFIGSGAIESGNKTVLQRRLKQSGMRWSVKGAQPILTLRAKAESGLWDEDVINLICA